MKMFRLVRSEALNLLSIMILSWALAGSSMAGEFTPDQMPTKAEWQHFQKMNETQLNKLWTFEKSKGFDHLSKWSWQWRMGWVKRCERNSTLKLCEQLLLEGLADEAMVVRAEAASNIGKTWERTPNQKIIDALSKSYLDQRNLRHGTPLFVCDRIIEALHRIGGKQANQIASQLAKKHPSTSQYWAKIKSKTL